VSNKSKMQPQQRFNEESSDVAKLGLSESFGPSVRRRAVCKLVLIDSEAAMPTRANSKFGDADRLSGLASHEDDATVGSCRNANCKSAAETTAPTVSVSNKNVQALRFNGSSLTVDMYIPAQTVYGLNTNYIDLYVSTEKKYQFGQLFKAPLGSDPLWNGGEFGERCDANPEPSIALARAKACVETMGHPLPEEGEDIARTTGKTNQWKLRLLVGKRLNTMGLYKLSLIDLDPEMGTRANSKFGDADRLSGKALKGDAIVGSHGNLNCESAAETTAPLA